MLKSRVYTKELANGLIELKRDIQRAAIDSAINWRTISVIAPTHAPYLSTLNLSIEGIGFSCDIDMFKEFIEKKLKEKGLINQPGQDIEVNIIYKEVLTQKAQRSEAMRSIYEPILDSAVLLTELQARDISDQITEKLQSKIESREEIPLEDKAPNTGKRKREGIESSEVKESARTAKSDDGLKNREPTNDNDNGKQHTPSLSPEHIVEPKHSWRQYVRDREQDSKKSTHAIVHG